MRPPSPKISREKWTRAVTSGRRTALQAQSPEFKPQTHQNNNNDNNPIQQTEADSFSEVTEVERVEYLIRGQAALLTLALSPCLFLFFSLQY
jgi:hypothetical protein